ncbi:uncharacterized protein CDAR_172091 [Caerostris darwini]|uniref:Cyclase n=1 Tax=Caerostris darwini TaxID=1538125 RepID=A0AAV4U909_9ARAC|nr:uncharacterized protein CDAR_172091 [Caerostris darwini]
MLGEDYSASVHLGTHMDAPAHFDPNGTAVDKIPIRHFVAPAAVIDITAKAELDPDCGATVEDLLHWERLTGQSLNQTIVLLKSGWGQKWNNMTAYIGSTEADINKMHFPGFSEESARWLVENRNVYGIGSETISFDRGAANTFPAHQIFLGHGIFGLENVANLDKIPIYGAKLYVMPMKIGKGSGAPTRVIAVFPNVIFSNSSSEM